MRPGSSDEGYLAHLKCVRPEVDWDAEMEKARKRRERKLRRPWNRLRHHIDLRRRPELHRHFCDCSWEKQ